MATSINGSLGQPDNYSSINDLITKWPTAAQNQGIQLSGIAFDGVETNYTNPSVIANLTLATNDSSKSGLSYGAPAGIGVPASYAGWFNDATKTRAEINHDPNTTNPTPSQVLKVKWADNQEITSATIALGALLPKTSSGDGDQGNEAGVLKLFRDGTQVSATNFTIARLNPPAAGQKPIVVYPSGVTFIGDRTDGNLTFQIVGDTLTGATFDELQFSATAYDSPTAAYLASSSPKDDSSDYLVRSIQYQGISTPTPTPTPTSPSLFQFAQPNYTVAEGGVVTINVTRTGGTAAASINYATLDGSASSAGTAADYTGTTGVLNFAAGQTTANFTVTALTDSILESPETANLVLFGGNVGSNPSLLTINDVSTPTPTPTPTPTLPSLFEFQQPNYTVAEGGAATINVTRTGGTAAASINYVTVDGSASSPGDYTPAAGVLNFAAGQTTASFTVTALTDSILESPETVNLVLFGGNVGSNPSILTINDVVSTTVAPTPTPTLPSLFQFQQPNYTVAEGGVATINVTRTGDTAAASINYATVDGSASSPGDYTPAAGVLNFAAGQTTASFTVTALTDSILESPETVNLVLFGGNVGSNPSILTINDVVSTTVAPTPTPTLPSLFQFQQPNYTVAEGGVATINVTRTGDTAAASINYATFDGSATSAGTAGDYTSVTGLLNFAAGQTTASFTVPTLTDSILESPETVNLVLFGGNVSNPSILTINDVVSTTVAPTPTPTLPSLFQFQQPNYTVAEGSPATINVIRTGGTGAASINYATLDGSASSPGDYTPAAGTLNFAAGQTTASFTVPTLTDSILESPETVNLVLLGGNVGSTPSILTINDVVSTTVAPTPTPATSTATQFVFSAATFTTPESSGLATVTVNRIGPTTATGTIGYSTLDGTALSTGGTAADYASTAGVLSFGPGVTSTTFTIFVNPDTVPEMTETVNLFLNNGPVGTPSTAQLQIIDGSSSASDNAAFQYSASDYGSIGSPGGTKTITVTRSSGLGAASVDYIILAGTPGAGPAPVYGSDYLLSAGAPTGRLSFANGQLSQTFIIQDSLFTTNNGIVRLGLANPTGGILGSTAATSITLI